MTAQPRPRRVLAVALGSFGDVHPMLGVSKALEQRGHSVEVVANPLYADTVANAGLKLLPLGDADDFLRAIENPRMWHPTQGMKVLGGEIIIP